MEVKVPYNTIFSCVSQNICGTLVALIGLASVIFSPDNRIAGFVYFLAACALTALAIGGLCLLLRLVCGADR